MDYYEELGVGRSASAEEIRHRYKQLVRLLHPDHCADEQVRPLAELQMKRLNGIVSVLTNEEDRALYDRSLRAPVEVFPLPVMGTRRLPWFSIAAAVAVLMLLIFFFLFRPPESPIQAVAPPVRQEPPSTVVHKKSPASTVRSVTTPRIPLALPPPVANFVDVELSPDPPAVPLDLAVPQSANFTLPVALVANPNLPGVWLLASSHRSGNEGLYPAEFIELRMVESAGTLRGSYRARYRVVDRTISPVVAFQFEGPAERDKVSMSWKSPDGSRGDVQLRLISPDSLDVRWVANQLGQQLGLVSGTATLTRKMD